MGFRDVIVLADGSAASSRAIALMQASLDPVTAHLTATVFELKPSPAMLYPEGGAIVTEFLTERSETEFKAALATVEEVLRGCTIPHVLRQLSVIDSQYGESFAHLARFADLAVIGLPADEDERAPIVSVFEAALFDSGRPVLLVPEASRTRRIGDRILVAWDGSRFAARALGDADRLIRGAHMTRVVAVRTPHFGAEAESEPTEPVIRHIARSNRRVDGKVLDAPARQVAAILLDEAEAFDADVVVLGGYGHSRTREWILGGVTRDLVAQSRVPLFLSH